MVLAALVQLVVACGSQQPATGSQASLVMGTVTAGPIAPVSHAGRPNTRPLPGATVEALHGSSVKAVTHSDDRGHYKLSLRPGTYLIRARPQGRFPSTNPGKKVTIFAGETLTVNLRLDTGIR
jgi:Carboxypeptidase regulatory-like domain